MNKNEILVFALSDIDEKYIEEGNTKMKRTAPIIVAASLLLVLALSLYLFIPFAPVNADIEDYAGSAYFPLIEKVEDYRISFLQPKYKNNFEAITAGLGSLLGRFEGGAGGSNNVGMDMAPSIGENGSYIEVTDNQVEGVIESDLFKMTDKYIFRIGYRTTYSEPLGKNDRYTMALNVYSVDKENSALISQIDIPTFDGEKYSSGEEMYLSEDGTTITILKNFTDENNKSHIGVISLDVGNVENIVVKGAVSIDGKLNTSRMVDGRLILVTEFYFNRNNVDYNDPATFVPTIDSGDGAKPIEFKDIIFPNEVGNTRYSVVALLDTENFEVLGASALLNYTSDVYVSEENIFITREYSEKAYDDDQSGNYTSITKTDIAVLNYSGDGLEKKGIITANGQAEDQYSFDEKDGYLRVVTTTFERKTIISSNNVAGGSVSVGPTKRNVSLYIFNLADNSLAYKVEDFAIEGEEATAVRFEGDKLYVCTAVVVNFTDPVYFFDLSDYENITFSDTGVIDGYSDHLINLGDGFTLGIGRENWQNSKVEVYEQQGDKVVSVAEFSFDGTYSTNYKSYLVNREENMFGFGVTRLNLRDNTTGKNRYVNAYVLLVFNGYSLVEYIFEIDELDADSVRAVFLDGYLYITTPYGLTVEKID